MSKPKLIIADDSALMRQAIETALNAQYEVVAHAEDGKIAISAVAEHSPQLVLLDVSMPRVNGLEAARRIKRAHPAVLLIFVSEHDEESYREAAFDAGGSGYVIKGNVASNLLPAIRDVLAGREYGRSKT